MPEIVIAWYSDEEPENGYHIFFDCDASRSIRQKDLVIDDKRRMPPAIIMCDECLHKVSLSRRLSSVTDATFRVRY